MGARFRRLARHCAALSVIVIGAAGCASTVIDPSVTTESGATTTTVPSGPATELLPRLLAEAGKLSDAIGENDHKGEQMARVDNLWTAARPEVADADGVLVLSFDAAIDLCRAGARLNRPADADKCFRNLTSLVSSYLGSTGAPPTS